MTAVLPLRFGLFKIVTHAPVNTVLPVVTGTTNEGDTLTTDDGTWTGDATITFAYQWGTAFDDEDGGYLTDSDGRPLGTPIDGETGSTYVVQAGDADEWIFCDVVATNGAGSTRASSDPVGGPAIETYDGIAATNGAMPTALANAITSANTRSGHFARNSMTQLKVAFYNYYILSGPELGPGATMDITATVEYPPGVFYPILFSGVSTGTVPDGGTLFSDWVTVTIPNGERFWIRTFQTCSAGLVFSSDGFEHAYMDSQFMGDCWESGVVDKTMGGELDFLNLNTSYHPTVIAPIPVDRPAIFILGSSIPSGTRDTNDMSGDSGSVARSIGGSFGYFKGTRDAIMAVDIAANMTERIKILTYCSHAFVDCGTNDYAFGGQTAAQIKTGLSAIWAAMGDRPTYQLTIIPRTTSDTDDWTSVPTQDLLPTESVRLSVNTDLRSGTFEPSGGIIDTDPLFDAGGGYFMPGFTLDGVHPTQAGYILIKDSGLIDPTALGPAETVPSESGSAWGDHGTNVTISTFRRSNDCAIGPNTNTLTTVRGANGLSSGLKYFEIEMIGRLTDAIFLGLMTGATTTSADLDDYIGHIPDSFGIVNNGNGYAFVGSSIFTAHSGGVGAFVANAGDVFGCVVDFTNKVYYLARNNVWYLGADPATGDVGTGPVASWTGTPTLYPAVTFNGVFLGPVRLRTSTLLYAPPGSATAWG